MASMQALNRRYHEHSIGKSGALQESCLHGCRLLQGALGGVGCTVIIICCSPAARSAPETLSTLRFGARAQGIVNTMQVATTTSRCWYLPDVGMSDRFHGHQPCTWMSILYMRDVV